MNYRSELFNRDLSLLCQGLNTPRALSVWLLWKYKEHRQLCELSADPSAYRTDDVTGFRDDYLITEYLRKAQFLETGIDTKAVALSSFAAAEESCRITNYRLRQLSEGARAPDCMLEKIISRAQHKIEMCLGKAVKWSKMLDWFRWGPGATSSLRGEDATIEGKLREQKISITHEALPLFRAALATDYNWLRIRGVDPSGPTSLTNDHFNVVHASRGLVVPKNAKTDRVICAEPSGNLFLQLGFGAYIRRCLLRVGINLDDQTVNQRLAGEAVSLGLATVDLKAASDTISQAVVWLLLPFSWASALARLRTTHTSFDGETPIALEKFSSMGNGFTFELESLIFWALAESTRDELGVGGCVSVYGDDIILPSSACEVFMAVLQYFGFAANPKKTHSAGPFRESCGKHYFGGQDVTPVYQQKDPASALERRRHINRLTYHAIDRGYSPDRGPLLADCKLRAVVAAMTGERERRETYLPLCGDPSFRTLDGGIYVDMRNPKIRRYYIDAFGRAVLSGSFQKAKSLEVEHAVAYTVYLRRDICVFEPDPLDPGVLQRRIKRPFDGTLTVRGWGGYVRRRTYIPNPRELRWTHVAP